MGFKGPKAEKITKKAFRLHKSKESVIEKMVGDIKMFAGRLPEGVKDKSLVNGYGEDVCYVINDLLNRELIKRNFRFKDPNFE